MIKNNGIPTLLYSLAPTSILWQKLAKSCVFQLRLPRTLMYAVFPLDHTEKSCSSWDNDAIWCIITASKWSCPLPSSVKWVMSNMKLFQTPIPHLMLNWDVQEVLHTAGVIRKGGWAGLDEREVGRTNVTNFPIFSSFPPFHRPPKLTFGWKVSGQFLNFTHFSQKTKKKKKRKKYKQLWKLTPHTPTWSCEDSGKRKNGKRGKMVRICYILLSDLNI